MSIERKIMIKEVITNREKRIFHTFPNKLYRKNPEAVPYFFMNGKDSFNPRKNPAYRFCRVVRYLAYQDGSCVGRAAGIINERVNQRYGEVILRITRIDFIDDTEVSRALVEAVEAWGREQGAVQAAGPLGFHNLDAEGMLIEGFEQDGPFFTIYNAPYYSRHMELLGYQKDVDWVEFRIEIPKEPMDRLNKMTERMMGKTGICLVEPKRKKEVLHYAESIFRLLNLTYQKLYGFVELDDEQIRILTKQYCTIIPPRYIKLLFDKEKQLIGFGLTAPSLNDALRKCGGKRFPTGWYHINRALHGNTKKIDLYLVGVHPDWQGKGLPLILLQTELRCAAKDGFTVAYTGPTLEDNKKAQSMWHLFKTELYKRRRSYSKDLTK